MSLAHEVQVALSADFLKALAKLPKPQQRGVRQWITKFQADPTQRSLNYEKINGTRDSKVRTGRVDQCYRIVIIHPPKGQVYLCVWVDHHDDAMDWAMRKVFEVNPRTGSFQVWEPVEGQPPQVVEDHAVAHTGVDPIPEKRLLSGHEDTDLLMLGVPEPLLPAVRSLRTDADLDGLAGYLPADASDALYLLASGYTVDECLKELLRVIDEKEAKAPAIDTEDIAAALERPESRQSFKVIEDNEELADILAAPLEQWRIFLHPSQEGVVRMNSKGSARVLGGAGTGKTVVAMHRARYLAKEVFCEPGDKVLFTTYTTNLARDISDNLERLCGDEFSRIEVTNLHSWSARFLRERGIKVRSKIVTMEQSQYFWEQVYDELGSEMKFSQTFFEQEWEKVVQAQNISTLEKYLRARRAGRGTRLTRKQREEIWQVFAAYRKKLDQAGKYEFADIIRMTFEAIDAEKIELPYRAIIADEVQDFRTADLQLLRALIPEGGNDIFVVGDAHQRIYGHKASLSRCGISVRGRQSRRLKINYRTTEKIRQWATGRLEGIEIDDLDGGSDDGRGEHSLRMGTAPKYTLYAGPEQEAEALVQTLKEWKDSGVAWEEICVVARKKKAVNGRYADILKAAGIPFVEIQKDASERLGEGVRIASMHRVKGLEFPRVIIAGAQKSELGSRKKFADAKAKELYLEGERKLLYVAATRARDELVVMGFGKGSVLVEGADEGTNRAA